MGPTARGMHEATHETGRSVSQDGRLSLIDYRSDESPTSGPPRSEVGGMSVRR